MTNDTYITDFGVSLVGKCDDGTEMTIERYGVWERVPAKGNRHQVVEVGNDLARLMEKYKITADRVISIKMNAGN
jgi:hypothetical protein